MAKNSNFLISEKKGNKQKKEVGIEAFLTKVDAMSGGYKTDPPLNNLVEMVLEDIRTSKSLNSIKGLIDVLGMSRGDIINKRLVRSALVNGYVGNVYGTKYANTLLNIQDTGEVSERLKSRYMSHDNKSLELQRNHTKPKKVRLPYEYRDDLKASKEGKSLSDKAEKIRSYFGNMRHEEMSDATGLGKATFSYIFNGQKFISDSTTDKIDNYLKEKGIIGQTSKQFTLLVEQYNKALTAYNERVVEKEESNTFTNSLVSEVVTKAKNQGKNVMSLR